MELAASTPRCRLWAPKTRPGLPAKRRRRRPRFQRLCSRSWRPRSSRLTRPRRAAPPGRSVGRSGAPAVNVNVDGRETGCTRETGDGETGRRGDGETGAPAVNVNVHGLPTLTTLSTSTPSTITLPGCDAQTGCGAEPSPQTQVHGCMAAYHLDHRTPPPHTTAHHRTPPHTTAHHHPSTSTPTHLQRMAGRGTDTACQGIAAVLATHQRHRTPPPTTAHTSHHRTPPTPPPIHIHHHTSPTYGMRARGVLTPLVRDRGRVVRSTSYFNRPQQWTPLRPAAISDIEAHSRRCLASAPSPSPAAVGSPAPRLPGSRCIGAVRSRSQSMQRITSV